MSSFPRDSINGSFMKKKEEGSEQMSFDDTDIVLTAKDIILQPFLTGDEETTATTQAAHHEHQATAAFNAYLSTPKFVTTLTDLSLELIHQTN